MALVDDVCEAALLGVVAGSVAEAVLGLAVCVDRKGVTPAFLHGLHRANGVRHVHCHGVHDHGGTLTAASFPDNTVLSLRLPIRERDLPAKT